MYLLHIFFFVRLKSILQEKWPNLIRELYNYSSLFREYFKLSLFKQLQQQAMSEAFRAYPIVTRPVQASLNCPEQVELAQARSTSNFWSWESFKVFIPLFLYFYNCRHMFRPIGTHQYSQKLPKKIIIKIERFWNSDIESGIQDTTTSMQRALCLYTNRLLIINIYFSNLLITQAPNLA